MVSNFIQTAWSPVAEFYWFNLQSGTYNPDGVLKADNLRFPAGDGTVDVIFAASVFTHLLETDALHYLREISRVLAARGVALLSIHENAANGQRFSGTESRIDIDPGYFLELAGNAGLRELDCIDEFCGQRLYVLKRASRRTPNRSDPPLPLPAVRPKNSLALCNIVQTGSRHRRVNSGQRGQMKTLVFPSFCR